MNKPFPDSTGWWKCKCKENTESYKCEIYKLPDGQLCAWLEDCNRSDLNHPHVWTDDEWLGHIPVHCLEDDGIWTKINKKGK